MYYELSFPRLNFQLVLCVCRACQHGWIHPTEEVNLQQDPSIVGVSHQCSQGAWTKNRELLRECYTRGLGHNLGHEFILGSPKHMKRTFFITLLQCILQSNIFIEFESISVYLFLAQGTYSSLVVQRKGPKALCRLPDKGAETLPPVEPNALPSNQHKAAARAPVQSPNCLTPPHLAPCQCFAQG